MLCVSGLRAPHAKGYRLGAARNPLLRASHVDADQANAAANERTQAALKGRLLQRLAEVEVAFGHALAKLLAEGLAALLEALAQEGGH